jgi:hypothetical protein
MQVQAVQESRYQLKRLARRLIEATGLREWVNDRIDPLWTRYVELTAPCVFVHIPKTAGTSISRSIGMRGISHSTAAQWQAHLGAERFNRRFRFSIVRHPVDRLVSGSLWVYSLTNKDEGDFGRSYLGETSFKASCDQLNLWLNSHLRSLLTDEQRFNSSRARMLPQLMINGSLAVDYIGKYEELELALREVGKHLPMRHELPTLKRISTSTKKSVVLDRDIIELISICLQDEFKAFGYDPYATIFRVNA